MDHEGSSRVERIEAAPAPELPLTLPPPPRPRKPRGRPLGSKNKPKPPVVVTRESEAAMRPVVLELDAGCEVATAVVAFARRRRVGVSVLCGRGAVAAVTLRLPTSPATAVTLHGRFEILSLSGTVLPSVAGEGPVPPPFSVSLAGAGGQVIGGTLAGEMMAADGLVVVAATFGSAEVYRLPAADPAEDEEAERHGGREEGRNQQQQQTLVAASADDDVGQRGFAGVVGLSKASWPDMVSWGVQPPASLRPADPATSHY
ncbi:hypothetical protein GUJ93_ZPchr0007g5869 [Zizania palustris]|uniref:PPC domain-containing protein n=1 Tax=Zizania palustris TaxID=103762 RepID=A0A8J5T5V7_ZIZPA|nr:hypothetical protein GUJ93_ZPchr0007g5869 [Zizania palustris]